MPAALAVRLAFCCTLRSLALSFSRISWSYSVRLCCRKPQRRGGRSDEPLPGTHDRNCQDEGEQNATSAKHEMVSLL